MVTENENVQPAPSQVFVDEPESQRELAPTNQPDQQPNAPKVDLPGTMTRMTFVADDGPLGSADVRRPVAVADLPDDLQAQLRDAEERLRLQTLGEAGTEPEAPAHRLYAAPAGPVQQPGPVGAFQGQATNYIVGERDIFASSIGQVITSYTMDSTSVTADANGDKIVYEGTLLQASGAKLAPHVAGQTAVGALRHRTNLRYGDTDIGFVIGGRLREDKCWDNAVFGTVLAQSKTDLAAIGIYFTKYDA